MEEFSVYNAGNLNYDAKLVKSIFRLLPRPFYKKNSWYRKTTKKREPHLLFKWLPLCDPHLVLSV